MQHFTKDRDGRIWEEVGVIGVDAGLCWIGDPCYCVTPDAGSHPADSWHAFCAKLETEEKRLRQTGRTGQLAVQWHYPLGHPGLGVSVPTGWGDGVYPVLTRWSDEGRIAEVRVVFIDEAGDFDDFADRVQRGDFHLAKPTVPSS